MNKIEIVGRTCSGIQKETEKYSLRKIFVWGYLMNKNYSKNISHVKRA